MNTVQVFRCSTDQVQAFTVFIRFLSVFIYMFVFQGTLSSFQTCKTFFLVQNTTEVCLIKNVDNKMTH